MNKNLFAQTPPMGWNSYDYYDTTVNEEEIKANADYMAKNLKKFGWEYIVVDIAWFSNDAGTKRDKFQYIPFGDMEIDGYGRLQPSPNRFPSSAGGKGFKPLADYVHSLGLKFGIHIMRGIPRKAAQEHMPILGSNETADVIANPASICVWNPDMYGVYYNKDGQAYYDSIIEMYAQWGVDFIKCDDICDSVLYRDNSFSGWNEIIMIHKAIDKCNRQIVLSLSPGPAHIDRAWDYGKYANMWRITDDFWDDWKLLKNMFWRCEMWQDHVKEGCFPDCDMLPMGKVGKGFGMERTSSFTKDELKTMMTLWCMFRSPLMIGAELTKLEDWELALLTNEDLLDLMRKECRGTQIIRTDDEAVWQNVDSKSGRICLAFFNLSDSDKTISFNLDELEEDVAGKGNTEFYELWDKEKASCAGTSFECSVPAHGVKVYRLQ
jgi:hypothetical protein